MSKKFFWGTVTVSILVAVLTSIPMLSFVRRNNVQPFWGIPALFYTFAVSIIAEMLLSRARLSNTLIAKVLRIITLVTSVAVLTWIQLVLRGY